MTKIGHDGIVGVHEFHCKVDKNFKEGNDACHTNDSIGASSQEERHEASKFYTSGSDNEFIALKGKLCPKF